MIKETGCTSETVNHYILRSMKSSVALIFFSGHPDFCPQPLCTHSPFVCFFLFLGTIFLYYSTSFCVTIGTLHDDPVPEIDVWSQVCFYNYCSNVSYCMLPRHRHWQMPCDLSTQIFSSECIDLSRCPHVAASVCKELEHIDFICANMLPRSAAHPACQLCFFSLFVVKLVATDVPVRAPDTRLMIKGKKVWQTSCSSISI